MRIGAKTLAIVTALAVFVGLPLFIYALGDAPRRSVLKESLSILTLLAFSSMLGQFFLARSNERLLLLFRPRQIRSVHKVLAYGAVLVILVHPFLIVLPRYFEAGVRPWDAFVTMVTTFDSRGILLGLGAWVLLLVLALTSALRIQLIKRLPIQYPGWRYVHSGLAVTFVVLAMWHAIDLGRHTDGAMSVFFITVALFGIALLVRLYLSTTSKKPTRTSKSEGART